jgi:hypothetical protein
VTQDAARDTPFRQEISHTGLRRHEQFRKLGREKLEKIRPAAGIIRTHRPRGAPAGPARKIIRRRGHLTSAIRRYQG